MFWPCDEPATQPKTSGRGSSSPATHECRRSSDRNGRMECFNERKEKKMSEILSTRARYLNQTSKPSNLLPRVKQMRAVQIFILAPTIFGMPLSWRAVFFVLFFLTLGASCFFVHLRRDCFLFRIFLQWGDVALFFQLR